MSELDDETLIAAARGDQGALETLRGVPESVRQSLRRLLATEQPI